MDPPSPPPLSPPAAALDNVPFIVAFGGADLFVFCLVFALRRVFVPNGVAALKPRLMLRTYVESVTVPPFEITATRGTPFAHIVACFFSLAAFAMGLYWGADQAGGASLFDAAGRSDAAGVACVCVVCGDAVLMVASALLAVDTFLKVWQDKELNALLSGATEAQPLQAELERARNELLDGARGALPAMPRYPPSPPRGARPAMPRYPPSPSRGARGVLPARRSMPSPPRRPAR